MSVNYKKTDNYFAFLNEKYSCHKTNWILIVVSASIYLLASYCHQAKFNMFMRARNELISNKKLKTFKDNK